MRETGKAAQRFLRNEFGFAAHLHAADNGSQVDVAAALARPDQGALDLDRAAQHRRARVGNAEAPIGVAVEAESRAWVIPNQAPDHARDFLRRSAARRVANHDAAYLLLGA